MPTALPTNSQRILIMGKTGTGKTCAAVWHLAMRNLEYERWVVINHKADSLINSVPGAKFLELNQLPEEPGVHIYSPIPVHDDSAVTNLLWAIHKRGNIGVYIDEGYMINARDPALQALLTQGRSKKIPMIILSQRPVWLSRFAVSESDFFQIFRLTDDRDIDTLQAFVPTDLKSLMQAPANKEPLLKKFHSLYYDVGKNSIAVLTPVPTSDTVLNMFRRFQSMEVIDTTPKKVFI